MDAKLVEKAIAWVRGVTCKNKDELPDWGSYNKIVKAYLNDPYNMPFKLPQEYHYAYLRVKGMSHSDALERMGVPAQTLTVSAPKKESWWKFW